jgi:putative intracellular protease/amidase
MSERNVAYLLVFEGLADWEPALTAVALTESDRYELITVGFDRHPVKTMGGLRILPDVPLTEIDPDRAALVLIPGGKAWETEPNENINPILKDCYSQGAVTAFICAATLIPARLGWTAGVRHTSNALAYLKSMVPDYRDEASYVDELAVTGGNMITASGLGYLEFTIEICRALDIYSEEERQARYQAMKHGVMPEGI